MKKIRSILEREYGLRQNYIDHNALEAYRIYDREEAEFPLAVDIYKDNAVVHVFGNIHSPVLKELEQTLAELLRIRNIYYKNRTKDELRLPKSAKKELEIREYGHKFFCNLSDYLDTGLFLDHRETRKWIQQQSKGKIVLNTFAYTGSFSIYAAAGGAAKTFSVDLSKTYCEWIKKNLELNKLPKDTNWVYKMDTLEFFKYAKRKNLQFDIIIIDPPSFSRNKNSSFSVQKDHPALINAALELLTPKGFIVFSNNKLDFRLNKEKLTPCTVRNIQRQTIPPDFTRPNTHYCFEIRGL
jgi:23S rRNA (cytosine1962-C5)-methyltransferase